MVGIPLHRGKTHGWTLGSLRVLHTIVMCACARSVCEVRVWYTIEGLSLGGWEKEGAEDCGGSLV